MTLVEYLRDARTLTQAEVDHRTSLHDAQDLTPEERATFDTGSMHRVELS